MSTQVKPLSLNLEKAQFLQQVLEEVTEFHNEGEAKVHKKLHNQVSRIVGKLSENENTTEVNENNQVNQAV